MLQHTASRALPGILSSPCESDPLLTAHHMRTPPAALVVFGRAETVHKTLIRDGGRLYWFCCQRRIVPIISVIDRELKKDLVLFLYQLTKNTGITTHILKNQSGMKTRRTLLGIESLHQTLSFDLLIPSHIFAKCPAVFRKSFSVKQKELLKVTEQQ